MNSSKDNPKPNEIQETSTIKTILFSLGYFFNAFFIVAFNNYVWTFYEGELGLISIVVLWPIYMAIANVIFTIWSILSSPIVGFLTDKPMRWTKKWGFHTPWIVIGGLPTILFFFLIFTPPGVTGVESAMPILIYYLIMVCLYDTFNSLFQTHSFGAFPAHFRTDAARRKAGIFTQMFMFLANFFAIMIWSQIIIPGNPNSFTIAAFISLIIMIASLIIFIPGAKESIEIKERFIISYENAEKIPFFNIMKFALKQKNFMLAVFTYLSFMIALGLTSMNAVNFIDDVLQEEQYIRTIGSILMLISSVLTLPLFARLAKKIGHSITYTVGLVFFGFSMFLYMFVVDVFGFYIASLVNGMGGAMFTIMLSPIFADCYDEITVMTGKHHEATLIGIRNFFIRISVSIQSFIIAIVHVITVYDPNELTHTNEALMGLRLIQGLFPFIFCLVGALIFIKWFDMKGDKKQEILNKMREMGL
jgi:Na+/melibiose symporter-like transporter